jgi:hypothetical protein
MHGYGICTDFAMAGKFKKIRTSEDLEQLKKLINMAPKFAADHTMTTLLAMEKVWLEDEMSLAWIASDLMYAIFGDDAGACGLSYVLSLVIAECEGIHLATALDCNCNEFLLFAKKLPWQMTEREKELTRDELDAIFSKYVSVLTDEPIDIQYMELNLGD